MRDFFRSPLFRCLVCLVLVCCILVNCSPIRAKAFAVESATAVALACIFMLVSAASIGSVYVLNQSDVMERAGQQIAGLLQEKNPTSPTLWYDAFPDWDDFFPPDLPPDYSRFRILSLGEEVLSAAVYSVILTGLLDQMSGTDLYGGYGLMDSISFPLMGITYNISSSVPFCAISYSYRIPNRGTYFGFACCSGSSKPTVTMNGSKMSFELIDGYYYFSLGASSDYSATIPTLTSTPLVPHMDFGTFTSVSEADILHSVLADYFDNALLVEDALLNGTAEQLRNGTLSEDDIEIPAVLDLTAIAAAGNTFEEGVVNTMQQLADGTLSYEEYMDMITPDEVVEPDPSGPSVPPTDPTDPIDIPEDMEAYTFDLKDFFPFCIPFDLYDFFSVLKASPEAPQFHWEIQDLSGHVYNIDVDLSAWDSLASFFRKLQLFLFVTGLAAATRKYIKW